MSLSKYAVGAVMATADMDKAKDFYEKKLELEVLSDNTPDGPVSYKGADATGISVYLSPEHAGKSTATMAAWVVDDLEDVVDELTSKGVSFEQYGEDGPGSTDEKGIIAFEGGKVAFLRDPDGNTHSLNEWA
ncbi:MAG: VOC family protein [Actinomycetota bacterium]|nr:VOC family protein [Actinomycetota bacterium]